MYTILYTPYYIYVHHTIPYYYYHSSCIHIGAGKGYTWEESSKVIDIKVHIDGVEKREVEKREILTKRDIDVEIL